MKKDEHQPWLFLAMLAAFIAFIVFTLPAFADVVTCQTANCQTPTNRPKSAMVGADFVKWCGAGAVEGATQATCPTATWIPWGQLQPDSWTLTTTGWYRQVDIPTGPVVPPPPPPPPPPPIPASDIGAVCTPKPPINSVVIGMQSCTAVNNVTTVTTIIHVVKTTALDSVVYRYVQNAAGGAGDVVAIAAGTAPANTPCDPTQTFSTKGVTYYRIDKRVVTFSGNNRPPVVYSRCPG
jgi:hypothetical protein